MDDRRFVRSGNVEDRRNEVLPLGPFGTPGLPPNIFEGNGGTMAELDPKKDFIPQPKVPNQLSRDLGVDTLDAYAQRLGIPMGSLDARQER